MNYYFLVTDNYVRENGEIYTVVLITNKQLVGALGDFNDHVTSLQWIACELQCI